MKKLTKLFLVFAALVAWSNVAIAENTDCLGTTKVATEGVFTDGYIYKFTTVGTDVTVTFELLDNKAGLDVFIFTYNPDFKEIAATNVGGKKYSKTFTGQTIGANFKVACKFAFAGGLAVTKIFTYVVGSSCSDIPTDTQAPTAFTVSKGTVTYHSAELLLNATDNSGTVVYEITNGTSKFLTTGTSGVQKSYLINGLTQSTAYNFSVVAKDITENVAVNSPTVLAVTTSANTSTECAGSYTDAVQGEFVEGYNYTFTTVGTDVTVTFEILDTKVGVEAFMWTYNPNFSEVATTAVIAGKKFSKTFTGQAIDSKFKVACKFAFSGGMAVTKTLTYTVGNNCGGSTGPDTEIPTLFTATKGAVTGNSVELLLNATDNSGAVVYTITYGTTTLTVNGTSGVQKSYVVSGLNATTAYSFSVVAKDANGNAAANNPVVVSATTSVAAAGLTKIDFETVGQDWTWTLFENGDNAPTLYSVVENPSATGINTSAHCAKYIVNANGQPWAGMWSENITPFTFTADNCKVKMMVYKNVISNFDLKFEGAAGLNFEKLVPNTKINEWEELTFDYTSQIGKTFNRLVIIPDFPSTRTAGSINYWDNIFNSIAPNGIEELMVNNIRMYPNPVKDKLQIVAEHEISTVTVRNLLGQKVTSLSTNGIETYIDLSQLSAGNYFVTIKLANGQFSTQKLLKL